MIYIPAVIGRATLEKTASGLQIAIPVYQSWYRFLATPFFACLAIVLLRRIDDPPQWWFLILCLICAVP